MDAHRDDVRLVRDRDRVPALDELGASARVGLDGVLGALNRQARPAEVPAPAARWGFAWNDQDSRSRRWYPQGISTSDDRGESGGRDLVCVSWYDRGAGRGGGKGARVTFVDLTDRDGPRYRHVLLVDASVAGAGGVSLAPVRVHAGGIVWRGPYLYVAGTRRGVGVFRLDDILRVSAYGYPYVLPLSFWYTARTAEGAEQLRYSFLSLDQTASPAHLVAGEYGVNGRSTRLARFEIDGRTSLLRGADESRPATLHAGGVEHMQGATVVDGTYYVTASAGRFRRGDLWVGEPGRLRRRARVLPIGPEDIAYRPSGDELWSVTEYPGRRFVFAMDRAALTP
ncbi:MAG: hypothetical protein ACRDO8_01710 [Nocardioidaceae bacterium]